MVRPILMLIVVFCVFHSGALARENTLADRPGFPVSATAFRAVSPRSEQVWQDHLQAVNQQPLQAGCQPFRLAAQGRRQGSILLFHGFTACPQQFWGLAPQLAAAGYDVFAPLSPGHGRIFLQSGVTVQDQMHAMPAADEAERYSRYAHAMTDLLRDDPLRRLTGGASVGATLAMSAMVQNPWVYQRAFLAAPLFEVIQPQNRLLPAVGFFAGGQQGDWGPGCEDERSSGRAGYCQFLLGHLRATQIFGQATFAELAKVPTRIQVLGVEGDKTADNQAIGQAVTRLPFAQGCLYAGGANHSMLSVYDVPHEDKFWLPGLERQLLRFLQTGEFFDTTEPSPEAGLRRCK
ncbi:MAG: alpha/beta hydrolase [Candidatus Sericytochromatia bacterium]